MFEISDDPNGCPEFPVCVHDMDHLLGPAIARFKEREDAEFFVRAKRLQAIRETKMFEIKICEPDSDDSLFGVVAEVFAVYEGEKKIATFRFLGHAKLFVQEKELRAIRKDKDGEPVCVKNPEGFWDDGDPVRVDNPFSDQPVQDDPIAKSIVNSYFWGIPAQAAIDVPLPEPDVIIDK